MANPKTIYLDEHEIIKQIEVLSQYPLTPEKLAQIIEITVIYNPFCPKCEWGERLENRNCDICRQYWESWTNHIDEYNCSMEHALLAQGLIELNPKQAPNVVAFLRKAWPDRVKDLIEEDDTIVQS